MYIHVYLDVAGLGLSRVCCEGELSTIKLSEENLNPHSVACIPSGVLIVTTRAGALYAVDPSTGRCARIACVESVSNLSLTGRMTAALAVEVVASESCAFVTDQHCIRRITLPPQWFSAF